MAAMLTITMNPALAVTIADVPELPESSVKFDGNTVGGNVVGDDDAACGDMAGDMAWGEEVDIALGAMAVGAGVMGAAVVTDGACVGAGASTGAAVGGGVIGGMVVAGGTGIGAGLMDVTGGDGGEGLRLTRIGFSQVLS